MQYIFAFLCFERDYRTKCARFRRILVDFAIHLCSLKKANDGRVPWFFRLVLNIIVDLYGFLGRF